MIVSDKLFIDLPSLLNVGQVIVLRGVIGQFVNLPFLVLSDLLGLVLKEVYALPFCLCDKLVGPQVIIDVLQNLDIRTFFLSGTLLMTSDHLVVYLLGQPSSHERPYNSKEECL